jgi:acetyl esterase/lipase
VGLYPVVDLVGFHDVGGPLGAQARRFTEAYLGGTPADAPDRYRAVASTTYVSPAAPPTLLLVPEADQLVPPEGAHRFAAHARAAGVDVTVVSMASLDHSFDLAPFPDRLFREITLRWLGSRVGTSAGR